MNHRLSAVLALALYTASSAMAADAPWNDATLRNADTIRERALAGDDAWTIVDSLSREVGPRPAGSAGDRKAVAWGLRTLRALGFANVHSEPVKVPHWSRGSLSARVVGDAADLAATSLGGSVGTSAGGVTAEVVMTENVESLRDLAVEQVTGRIVYFDQHTLPARDGSGYGKAVGTRVLGAAEAARRGAVGVVIRTLSTATDRLPHTGAMRYDPIVKKIPAIAISTSDADALSKRLAAGEKLKLHLESGARDLGFAQSANVIGEIPGSGDGIVLLGAHLDSWDLARGSNDDGAGIAIVTAAAKVVKEVAGRPRRTLRVVMFANEEFGGSGADRYVLDHARELDRHTLAMEADFGSAPVWGLSGDVAADRWPIVEAMVKVLAPLKIELGNNQASGGSDVGPQRALGVPLLSPRQDGTKYFDTHHSAADTMAIVDREGLKQAVATFATAAYLAAEYEPGFGRMPVLPQ